ncbi:MAG: SRPBCC family protein, partial [Solirubrobacterales bacterium]|nr:SRPBCC family protein [Solirubrobacterales bacterium]
MQTVVVDRHFALPPERVFAYLAEHENLEGLFGAKVKRLNDGTDGTRNGVGSARQMRVLAGPPFVETTTEVVENELIRYRITKGSPLRDHEGVMTFRP